MIKIRNKTTTDADDARAHTFNRCSTLSNKRFSYGADAYEASCINILYYFMLSLYMHLAKI